MALTVATVLTACGIETTTTSSSKTLGDRLQQCLPLAVLKLSQLCRRWPSQAPCVATVLTACGIETCRMELRLARFQRVATVLTACGIET